MTEDNLKELEGLLQTTFDAYRGLGVIEGRFGEGSDAATRAKRIATICANHFWRVFGRSV